LLAVGEANVDAEGEARSGAPSALHVGRLADALLAGSPGASAAYRELDAYT